MVWITFVGPLSNVIAVRSNPGDRKPGWRFITAQHRIISFRPYSLSGVLLCPVTLPVRSGWTALWVRDSQKESTSPTNFQTTQCDPESLEEARAEAPQVVFSV